jgi:hypothetical protein
VKDSKSLKNHQDKLEKESSNCDFCYSHVETSGLQMHCIHLVTFSVVSAKLEIYMFIILFKERMATS